MHTLKTILLILLCAAVLGACGLKGPLYLPDENPAVEQKRLQDPDTKKEEDKAEEKEEEKEGNSESQPASLD